ncbi:MAG: hypothetical protein R3343_11160 [Nitriliruptorales bacterium]|nr:hypothetical protein [Nitriliruptorales bacterium]
MNEHIEVRKGTYIDSVALLNISQRVAEVDGVDAALVAMATELNLGFLEPMGFDASEVAAGPNDLLVAIRAADEAVLEQALARLEGELASTRRGSDADASGGQFPPRTTASALARLEDVELVLVSTPGEHAAVEAFDALHAGSNVMLFSDNVPLETEIELKRQAAEAGLLVMGPDCGTALVAGIGLGFANVVRPGGVGVVAASGTGAQQLMCLLDDAGVGISHVLGVGGRDLGAEVGGAATLMALEALDADPDTELVVILSKPPAPEVAERVREAAQRCTTPVVLGLIGPGADDLTAVSRRVLDQLGVEAEDPHDWAPLEEPSDEAGQHAYGAGRTAGLSRARQPRPGAIRGLFAGGTLCTEAVLLATESFGTVRSNVAPGDLDADSPHLFLDLGEDEFTRGRPHPMIDNTLRIERIRVAAEDPDVAVLLLDVVLGHGAQPDPAGELGPEIEAAVSTAEAAGRDLAVVVSLCGSAGDPQGREGQVRRLREAGASVHLSNAAAAREAIRLIGTEEAQR